MYLYSIDLVPVGCKVEGGTRSLWNMFIMLEELSCASCAMNPCLRCNLFLLPTEYSVND